MAVIIDKVDATVEPEDTPPNASSAPTSAPDTSKLALVKMHQNLRRLQKRAARLRAD